MLGEKDVSILGRLRDKIGDNFIDFKKYLSEKLDYVEKKIEPIKTKLLTSEENDVNLDK